MDIDPPALKSLLTFAARRLLADGGGLPRRIEVTCWRGPHRERRTLHSVSLADDDIAERLLARASTPAGGGPAGADTFSPDELRIVAALKAGPLGGKALAGRAGVRYGSRFRLLAGNLVDRGVLRKCDAGYELAGRADSRPTE